MKMDAIPTNFSDIELFITRILTYHFISAFSINRIGWYIIIAKVYYRTLQKSRRENLIAAQKIFCGIWISAKRFSHSVYKVVQLRDNTISLSNSCPVCLHLRLRLCLRLSVPVLKPHNSYQNFQILYLVLYFPNHIMYS